MLRISVETAKKWGISQCCFDKTRRVTKVEKFFDELCEDQRITTAEQTFRVKVFCATIYIATTQLYHRFEGLNKIASTFKALQPSIMSATDDELLAGCSKWMFSWTICTRSVANSIWPTALISIMHQTGPRDLPKIATTTELASLLMVEKYFSRRPRGGPILCSAPGPSVNSTCYATGALRWIVHCSLIIEHWGELSIVHWSLSIEVNWALFTDHWSLFCAIVHAMEH